MRKKLVRKKRIMALFLSLMLVFAVSVPGAFAAGFGDTAGHWAESVIDEWADLGVLNGADGQFRPNDPVTRAEMAAMLNRVVGYTGMSSNQFSDVSQSDWFYEDVLKLSTAGVMLGSDGQATPQANITREQAALLIARAFGIGENQSAANAFPDAGSISDWAKALVGGLQSKGYISGDSAGNFNPQSNITRAEAAKMIDNIVSGFYAVAGEFSGEVQGNAVVKTTGITLKDVTVTGDLYIMEGVGNGTVTLDSVKVTGKTFIRGGGSNSIIIKGDCDLGEVIIEKTESGAVRVKVEGNANVEIIYVEDGNDGVILEGNLASVVLSSGVNLTVASGTIDSLTIADGAASADVTISADATVKDLTVEASGAEISVAGTVTTATINGDDVVLTAEKGSKITNVVIDADDVTVDGNQSITLVKVEGGEGVSVTTPSTKVQVASDAGSVSTGSDDAAAILPGQSATTGQTTTTPSPGGGGGGGGGTGSNTAASVGDVFVSDLAGMTFVVVKLDGSTSNTSKVETVKVTATPAAGGTQVEETATKYSSDGKEWRCVFDFEVTDVTAEIAN